MALQLDGLVVPGICSPCWYSKTGSDHAGRRRVAGAGGVVGDARPRGSSSRSRRPAWPRSISSQRVLADVVDEEPRAGRVGVEGDAERVAQAPGEGLLAAVARRWCCPVTLQRAVPGPLEGVAGGMPPSRVMRRILPISMCWSRDASLAPAQPQAPGVVAAAVADADVEVAVLAELEVAAVVVARRRRHVVDQHHLARGVDHVARRQHEARDAVARRGAAAARARVDAVRVEEVDEAVGRELRVDRDAQQAALGVRADGGAGEGDGGCRQERAALEHAQRAALARDQHPAVGREGEGGRLAHRRHQLVDEVRREGRLRGRGREGEGGQGNGDAASWCAFRPVGGGARDGSTTSRTRAGRRREGALRRRAPPARPAGAPDSRRRLSPDRTPAPRDASAGSAVAAISRAAASAYPAASGRAARSSERLRARARSRKRQRRRSAAASVFGGGRGTAARCDRLCSTRAVSASGPSVLRFIPVPPGRARARAGRARGPSSPETAAPSRCPPAGRAGRRSPRGSSPRRTPARGASAGAA